MSYSALPIYLVFLLALGCSTPRPFQSGVDSAFSDLSKRGPSSEDQIKGVELSEGQKFKMIVFPKVRDFFMKFETPVSEKENEDQSYYQSKMLYHNPRSFEFTVLKKGNCKILVKEKKNNLNLFFEGIEDNDLTCFVVEVKKEFPSFFGKIIKELKTNDVLKVRLYMDEYFRPYGQSIDYAQELGREPLRTSNFRIDPSENFTSGLNLFPIDLPNLLGNRKKVVSEGTVRIPNNLFLTFKIKSMVHTPICTEGEQYDFKSIFGQQVKVGRCQTNFWPSSIETNNFYAILE